MHDVGHVTHAWNIFLVPAGLRCLGPIDSLLIPPYFSSVRSASKDPTACQQGVVGVSVRFPNTLGKPVPADREYFFYAWLTGRGCGL
jgi:hypothetical protein